MLDNFNFNIIQYSQEPQQRYAIIETMFEHQGVFKAFNIDHSKFRAYVKKAEYYYQRNKNPYHNFEHGFTGNNKMLTIFSPSQLLLHPQKYNLRAVLQNKHLNSCAVVRLVDARRRPLSEEQHLHGSRHDSDGSQIQRQTCKLLLTPRSSKTTIARQPSAT